MLISLATLGFVCVYAAFQSIAGVGLLLFGTPTLILIGYTFPDALAILVPTSLVVSLLQISGRSKVSRGQILRVTAQTGPSLMLGLSFVLLLGFENQLHLLIALALAAAVLLQVGLMARKTRPTVPKRLDWVIMGGIGLVHGLTNLGGGFLASYSAITGQDRVDTRSKIALGYSVFAVMQIFLLALLSPESFSGLTIYSMVIGGTLYLSLGRRLFTWTSEKAFKILMPVVTSLFCISVLVAGASRLQ